MFFSSVLWSLVQDKNHPLFHEWLGLQIRLSHCFLRVDKAVKIYRLSSFFSSCSNLNFSGFG